VGYVPSHVMKRTRVKPKRNINHILRNARETKN
jgi:hypothetical protein